MEELHGSIERISFQNEENGYVVAYMTSAARKDPVCLVGCLPGLRPGEYARVWGEWKKHLVYGWRFEATRFRSEVPADVQGIIKYLGSGLIKGIGPTYAKRIVDVFGSTTFDVLDKEPGRLSQVKGLGKKRADLILSCWGEQKRVREVMVFLQTHGVSNAYAQKIYKAYGDKSIDKVQENPYLLARDIHGIGFKTADQIARNLGIAVEEPRRIDAGIEFALTQLVSDGHTCYPLAELIPLAAGILEVDVTLVEPRSSALVAEERIVSYPLTHAGKLEPFAWSRAAFIAETGVAREMDRLLKATGNIPTLSIDKAIDWAQEKLTLSLASQQRQAVAGALSEKIEIITGGPGTGKSTITKAILAILSRLTDKIILAAPTGRAAKRMSEITGRPAKTLHSLLEWDFRQGGFKKNRKNPLEADLVIVDEASMVDTWLMYSLLKAIPDTARLILVGDVSQLPSVGPGTVLKDLIQSRVFPVVSLTEIFRQAADSRIITNAHKINRGKIPDTTIQADSDFFFLEASEPDKVLRSILTLVSERLPRKYGFNPLTDIQVLAPMRRGVFGIDNLNEELRNALNPEGTPITRMGRSLKKGDKIAQTRNNYKKEVFNGDIGFVVEIDYEELELTASFDDKIVSYAFHELDEIVLAYAVSIHKSQGSEYPCVVIPVHTSHYKTLSRNLLYTGVTRGKKLVVLVGNKKALFIAVQNNDAQSRYTGLRQAVEGTCIALPI